MPLALDILADILQHSTFDPSRARARAHRDPAGDRPGQRHARRHHLRPFPGTRLSRPGDGPAGAGHARRSSAGCRARRSSPICATITAPRAWCCRRPAISTTTASSTLAEKLLSAMPAERPVTTEPARYVGGDRREERDLEQLHLVLGFPGHAARRPRLLRRLGALDRVRRRHVVAAVPGGPREARAGLRDPFLRARLSRRRPVRDLCRHRRGRGGRTGAGAVRRGDAARRRAARRPSWRAPRRR